MHPIYNKATDIPEEFRLDKDSPLIFTHPAKTETMRMKRACELMKETALSVADIAEQTGFQTPGYFIKVFKNHFGETPGHYASRVRQQ